ncbi:error-prone DNA polymerase [Thalassotalea euphylliae]|nr:error-prone DNA polymerase [Thalassotalea euphylliae]
MYSELFCQSNFSFLEGASHPEELVIQANFLGYHAIAITDECSVAGVVRAHTAIKEHELPIQLIVGSVFSLQGELKVVLLCPSRQAYAELCRIITNARRRTEKGHYDLQEWDLMSLKHCLVIWLPAGKESDYQWGSWLLKHHSSRTWLGVQRQLVHNESAHLTHCLSLAKQLNLPVTACGGVLFHTTNRLKLQHTLTAIKEGISIGELGDKRLPNSERCLRTLAKLRKLFKQEWLSESIEIAKRCQFNLQELQYEYPAELVPSGKTAMAHLRELVEKGAAKRFEGAIKPNIQQLIHKELDLIEELNYPYFFLTIHDIVMFAQAQGILYQGRGSAANSVVCYCLEITAVDPTKIEVLFERFISKERDEPPDIDVDFEHERREEVIQYIYQKYGRERTALAATVITYRLKSAIREVGKALGLHSTQLEYFIKNINRRDKSLDWQTQVFELGLDSNSKKSQHFIELVNEIKGFPRHLSQHVGGFIISSGPLYELVPVENASMAERTVIQWDKDDLESLGLLKVDVLALGMLSAIRKCFTLISQHYQHSLTIAKITALPEDPNVYEMIQKADTVGLFQIESRAQMSMLPRLKPSTYYDLVIQIAIVRPGPIQGDMVHPFLKRRDGKEAVEYPSQAVKAVLERTLGVPIFQEQVIKLAMVAAGFSGGEADQLRRAMASWKKTGKLLQFKTKLINGMKKRGYSVEFAEQIFNQILGFGEYGFPESHSASFAVLAYVSAWLKYYYPAVFYTSLLNSMPMGFYSPSQLTQDAKRHGILMLPVCINQSNYWHNVVDENNTKAIRLGFCLVKGVSEQAATTLIVNRPKSGFTHMEQLKRIGISRQTIEQLASANAFQCIAGNRYLARWQLMSKEHELPLFSKNVTDQQQDFDFSPNEFDALLEDYDATGLSLNSHPITLLANAGKLSKFTRMSELSEKSHKSIVTVIGVVTGKQAPGTAGGVTFITLEDDTGNINVVVWAATSRAQKQPYMTAKILKVTGILEREGRVTHVIAGKLIDLSKELDCLNTKSRDFH